VHGVYAPGNVELTPVILHNTQKYISEKEPDVGDNVGPWCCSGVSHRSLLPRLDRKLRCCPRQPSTIGPKSLCNAQPKAASRAATLGCT